MVYSNGHTGCTDIHGDKRNLKCEFHDIAVALMLEKRISGQELMKMLVDAIEHGSYVLREIDVSEARNIYEQMYEIPD